MRRALRRALLVVVTVTLWVVARPAFAMSAAAPFCDDRGATALAPPPTLQAPDASVRRTPSQRCEHLEIGGEGAARAVQPGVAPVPELTGGEPATLPAAPAVLPSPCAAPAAGLDDSRAPDLDGAWLRVERPPRA